MEPRLLQLINNVILFSIDGKPIKHVAVLLNDDSENVPVGFTGHISFEAKSLDGNALVEKRGSLQYNRQNHIDSQVSLLRNNLKSYG